MRTTWIRKFSMQAQSPLQAKENLPGKFTSLENSDFKKMVALLYPLLKFKSG
jgi:hypothetical protein